jgi:hypothetical protein
MNPVRPIWLYVANVLLKKIDKESEKIFRNVLKGGLTG